MYRIKRGKRRRDYATGGRWEVYEKRAFNVGYASREPCNLPHVKPRREIFFEKKSILCSAIFSAAAAISSITFHKSKSSPECTYRAVVEVPPLWTWRGQVFILLDNETFVSYYIWLNKRRMNLG